MPRVRDFDPAALQVHASPKLQVASKPGIGFEGPVWQFTIFLPRWFDTADRRTMVCTAADERALQNLLARSFGGYTIGPSHRGVGHRGLETEANVHRVITVLTSRWRGTWRCFKTLRQELQACSGEEQILILHQDLWIV